MHHTNRLSALRRSWALTQAELGELLGVSEDAVSNYELAQNAPALGTAIGLEIVFDKPLSSMFDNTAFVVARRMLNVLAEFSIELEGLVDAASDKKRALVSRIGERIEQIFPGV